MPEMRDGARAEDNHGWAGRRKRAARYDAAVLVQRCAHRAGLHPRDGAHADAVISSGPIAISSEAKTNLGVKVEEAALRTLEKTFMVIGQVQAIPNRSAVVTSRIAGRVVDIKAIEGQRVSKGQPLVEVESLQVGNPPPRVQYASPIDGIVTDRDVVLNSSVEPDKHLLEIVDLSEVYAEGSIFEGQIARVKVGQQARVSVESFPGETFEGTVETMSGTLDPQTRTLKVWARVANPEGRLRPNMRATLHIVTEAAEAVVAIPHSAVLGDGGNLFAFVQTDATGLVFERRRLVTGIRDDRYVEVIEGIYPGDQVVTVGNYQLQYVTATPEAAAAGAADSDHSRHDHGAGATDHAHGWDAVKWMVGAIVVLLALNLAVMLIKGRRSAPSPAPPVPQSSRHV